MMGLRQKVGMLGEYDWLYRRYYHFKAGTGKWIKKQMARRRRREARSTGKVAHLSDLEKAP